MRISDWSSDVCSSDLDVLVDFNDKVVRDQVIARIDPSTFEAQINQGNAQVASARASLKQAQAALANAEADYRRKAELGAQQLVAKSDIDMARDARDTARAQVNPTQAQKHQPTASNIGRQTWRDKEGA